MKKLALIPLLACLSQVAVAAPPLTLTSTNFSDNAVLDRKHAGSLPENPNCVGSNISPQLSWHNAPEKTKSYVLAMIDPEGRNGVGVVHWIAYGIPAARTSFAEGEAAGPVKEWVGGRSTAGFPHYSGPCTPPGTDWHHYSFLVIATDLEPGALKPGLTLEEVRAALGSHALASAGLIGRFKKPD